MNFDSFFYFFILMFSASIGSVALDFDCDLLVNLRSLPYNSTILSLSMKLDVGLTLC